MIVKCITLVAFVVLMVGYIGGVVAVAAMNYAYEKGGVK